MKYISGIIKFSVVVMTLFSLSGCASTGGYFVDRGRDAADIFTVSAGVGIGGAKVRMGPLATGIFCNTDVVGLRSGEFFCIYPLDGFRLGIFGGGSQPNAIDILLVTFGEDNFDLSSRNMLCERGKAYRTCTDIWPFYWRDSIPVENVSTEYLSLKNPLRLLPGTPVHYYTQMEVAAGLVGTVRLGFNPGELLDFILGWFGIDIFSDDLEAKKLKKSNQNLKTIDKSTS